MTTAAVLLAVFGAYVLGRIHERAGTPSRHDRQLDLYRLRHRR